jgi:hypothetical protein
MMPDAGWARGGERIDGGMGVLETAAAGGGGGALSSTGVRQLVDAATALGDSAPLMATAPA